MDEEVEASPIAKRTPWPIGLHSVKERRKKENSASGRRSNSCRRGSNGRSKKGKERKGGGNKGTSQDRQQGLQELQRQQQQKSQQLEELLEPPPRSPPHPVPPSPQGPETGEEGLLVYGPSTPAWLRPVAPASIPAEPGRADGVVALACMMRSPVDPQSEIKGPIYGIEGIAPGFLRERRPSEDTNAAREDEAGMSGDGVLRPRPGGQWMTMGDSISPLSLTYF